MKETPIIIAKPSKFLLIGLLTMSVVVISLALLTYSFDKPTEQQPFATVISIIMLGTGLYALYSINDLHILTLYADSLIIRSVVGLTTQKIYISNISSWTEIKKMRGNYPRTFKHLTLYTDKGRYMISSETYSDYNMLRQSLIQGKQRNLDEEKKWHRRDNLKLALLCLIAALSLFYLAYSFYPQIDWQLITMSVLGLVMLAISCHFYLKKI